VRRWLRTAGLATLLALPLQACVTVRPPHFMRPVAEREWGRTLAEARRLATVGQFVAADSLLSIFAGRHHGTPEATETLYWRGVFRLDPANGHATAQQALPALRAYVERGAAAEHPAEAQTLLRLAEQIATLTTMAANALAAQSEAPPTGGRGGGGGAVAAPRPGEAATAAQQEAEIRRLRDELAKTNAELDRIRRRLVDPPVVRPPQ
jgi:hypothetical protein